MKKKLFNIPVYVYFVIATVLIMILFPREGGFRYSFAEGHHWQYGMLNAPFSFPILKTEKELKAEQDTIIQNFVPFFQCNKDVEKQQMERFVEALENHYDWTFEYRRYIEKSLKEIYTKGVMSADDYQYLTDNHLTTFKVVENDIAVPYSTNTIFTNKSAYSYIIDHCPLYLNVNVLISGNLNDYMHENLKYDAAISEKFKQDLLQKISPTKGMIEAGYSIVDRGDVVDAKTYTILSSLKQKYDSEPELVRRQGGLLVGASILVAGLMACFFFYLSFFRKKKIYGERKNIVFLLLMLTLFVFLTEIAVSRNLFNIYVIPYAIIPIIIRTFFDSRTAHITHFITILICSLMLLFPFEFIIIQAIVCMSATYVLKDLTQRSELIKCAFYIFIVYVVVYLGYLLLIDGNLSQINWYIFLYFGINFVFVMCTYPFIYIIEKVFGYISNVTLVELSDITRPALTLLSESTPGTFQHSLQVSMLGTAAAAKIDANPQLVRTGALYHDLGKVVNPGFFIENTVGNVNPHDKLTPEESARIITGHVPQGVEKAAEFGLPKAIVKFILTHHGKGKAKYFYTMFKNQYPDSPVNEEAFMYNGMNPDTKETAILMMADSVEAASRSLNDYSKESIRNLVNKIIDSQIADGLLSEAPLTFQNITTIKDVFVEKLVSMYHSRINYPELTKKQE